jgi:hypothetical protein
MGQGCTEGVPVISGSLAALTVAAQGGKAEIAKPLRGRESGVFEIALAFRGDAFREVDLIEERLKKLKEMLRWQKKNSK